VRSAADHEDVEIRTYEIIYEVIDDIEAAVIGMLEPEFKEVVTGEAEVREVFRIKGIGLVAGCLVQSGVITRNDKVRFLRQGTVIWNGTLTSLKRFTDDATEVRAGFECWSERFRGLDRWRCHRDVRRSRDSSHLVLVSL
jgi:translation initiation factor IF-2